MSSNAEMPLSLVVGRWIVAGGPLRSTITVGPLVTALALPAVSVTPAAARRRMTVPSEQLVRVRSEERRVGEEWMTRPVAVPSIEKSADVSPLTDSLNVTGKARLVA